MPHDLTAGNPQKVTDWASVALRLEEQCPSPFMRRKTAEILELVEKIGPLGLPDDVFQRAYKFLHWNEPDRIRRVLDVLLARTMGPDPQAKVRLNAWNYTVAALDEWIAHARIFYLV